MRRVLLLPTLGLLMTLSTPAQTANPDSVSEPEFADVFYRLDAGKLMPLERQDTGTPHVSVGLSMKGTTELPGGKSPVRFHAGERLEFIVRSGLSATQDPATVYHLRALNIKKNKRELLILTTKATFFHGATAKTGAALGELPLEFTRYGAVSIKVTTAPLPPGEYAVGTNAGLPGQAVFCFGVD
jgi:hypothetical protein